MKGFVILAGLRLKPVAEVIVIGESLDIFCEENVRTGLVPVTLNVQARVESAPHV